MRLRFGDQDNVCTVLHVFTALIGPSLVPPLEDREQRLSQGLEVGTSCFIWRTG
jgi:hypothetical protein